MDPPSVGVRSRLHLHQGFGGRIGVAYRLPERAVSEHVGVLAAAAVAVLGSVFLLKLIDHLVGLRVSPHDELTGLDISQHGEEGYLFF